MLLCLCGFHATVVYSSLGLLYAVSLTLGVAGWRVHFRRTGSSTLGCGAVYVC